MEALRIDQKSLQLSDSVVVRRVVEGEKELFEILLRRYNQKLFRVIRSYLKDADEVQDAMQNAYLKAYDKLYQFNGDASFSTWLIRIGINEALLRLKQIKKGKGIVMNAADDQSEMLNKIPDREMNAEKIIMHQEATQLLEKAIDDLPEKYRTVYMLKEIEGMSNEEISNCLGLTDANVKVRVHRAKSLLKEGLYRITSPPQVFEFGNSRCDAVVKFVINSIR
jgi:RNA polymerase sigma factor (sigma-70 family)